MPNAQSVGNPHPDATGLNKASGIDVVLTLQYTRTGLSGPTYMVSHACPLWGPHNILADASASAECISQQ